MQREACSTLAINLHVVCQLSLQLAPGIIRCFSIAPTSSRWDRNAAWGLTELSLCSGPFRTSLHQVLVVLQVRRDSLVLPYIARMSSLYHCIHATRTGASASCVAHTTTWNLQRQSRCEDPNIWLVIDCSAPASHSTAASNSMAVFPLVRASVRVDGVATCSPNLSDSRVPNRAGSGRQIASPRHLVLTRLAPLDGTTKFSSALHILDLCESTAIHPHFFLPRSRVFPDGSGSSET